jgi:hypothetical protein
MKRQAAKTGFDRYLSQRMKNARFSAAYAEARARIESSRRTRVLEAR